MQHPVTLEEPLARLAAVLRDHGTLLVGAAFVLTLAGLFLAPPPFGLAAIAAGGTLAALAALGQGVLLARRGINRLALGDIAALTCHDPAPCLVSTREGALGYLNPAARRRFHSAEGGTLARALGDLFANPSGVLHRMQDKAAALGSAREDVVTRRGHVRLTTVGLGPHGYLWRFEEITEARRVATRGAERIGLPMLIASPTGTILFMNEAARELTGGRVKHLDRLITDLPLRPGEVHQITTIDGTRRFRIAEVEGTAGRSEIFLLPPGAAEEAAAARERGSELEDLPVGLLQLRADGTIASANRIARELLRPDGADELVGLPLADRLEGLGRPVRDWLDEAVKGRGLGRPEVLRVRAPNAEVFLQVTLGRVPGQGEVRLMAVLTDATELKTLEAQFVQSQKMQAIGQLAGGVAHDFNNLLTAISGHCDLMLLRHDQGDPDYGDLVQIHQNANRAASLVGQLLAFSRKQTLQPQVIDLRDTLSDLTHLLNRLVGERIKLSLHHEPGLPPVRADRRQLEQVVMNLVVNARDAMPEGGEIRVETATRMLGDELRRDRAKVPPGRYVVVKVEDHGSGIPPDKIGKIFEPFYTTKRTGEGTGLGLSTAYGIVKQSGGFIFVDSVLATGTVFTLYFPAHDGPVDEPQPAHPALRTATQVRTYPARAGGAATAVARVVPDPEDDEADPAEADVANLASGPVPGATSPAASATASSFAASGGSGTDGRINGARISLLYPARGASPADPAGATGTAAPKEVERDGTGKAAVAPLPDRTQRQGEGVVLLVEDEAPVRAFASRALRMRGYTVIEAESAEEALATLEDATLAVDVFVTDVIMPGMDGPTWVRKALETRPGVKVVFVSGYAEASFGEEQKRIPNSVFLPKPFSLSELTATVQDQIH